jgi:hypothetical protein
MNVISIHMSSLFTPMNVMRLTGCDLNTNDCYFNTLRVTLKLTNKNYKEKIWIGIWHVAISHARVWYEWITFLQFIHIVKAHTCVSSQHSSRTACRFNFTVLYVDSTGKVWFLITRKRVKSTQILPCCFSILIFSYNSNVQLHPYHSI